MIKNGFHLPFREERWNQSKCRRSKLDFQVWKVLVKSQNKTKIKRNSMSFRRLLLMGLSDRVSPISKYVFDFWKKKNSFKFKKNLFPFYQICGGVLASWLVSSSPDRAVLGPVLQRPDNLPGPESDFDIKVARKVGRVLTSDKAHFVSLADNFSVQFSNLLKLPSGMENKKA